VDVTAQPQFIPSQQFRQLPADNDVDDTDDSISCGSPLNPWRVEAAAGQRINISLIDFAADDVSRDVGRDVTNCRRQYGFVVEKWNKKNVSLCAEGAAERRQSAVYTSDTNSLDILLTPTHRNHTNFLIKLQGLFRIFTTGRRGVGTPDCFRGVDFEIQKCTCFNFKVTVTWMFFFTPAIGCTNIVPPDNAWLKRSNNDIIIGCFSSQQTWQLKCDGRDWKGTVGTCPELCKIF